LDLSSNQITDAGLRELAGLSELASLNLSETQVAGTGLDHILTNRGLVKVDLSYSQVNDAGAERLKLLPLVELDLERTYVTDGVFETLKGIESLRKLKVGPYGITEQGVASFVRATGGGVDVECKKP
jgi:hypothetical protein